jgi:hypothetical protein
MRAVRYSAVLTAWLLWLATSPVDAQLLGNSVGTAPCSSGVGGDVSNSQISTPAKPLKSLSPPQGGR